MSHSSQTHEKYYQAVTGAPQAAVAHHFMEGLHQGESKPKAETEPKPVEVEETATEKRVFYTDHEEKLIREHFAPAIEALRPVTSRECEEFLVDAELDRTVKQIQDKVRTMVRQLRRKRGQ